MTLQVWFWLVFFVTLASFFWSESIPDQPWPRRFRYFMLFLLISILGMAQFGSPVK